MSIHQTRRSSMTWSYVGFAIWVALVLGVLMLVAAGWVQPRFEAWRLIYLLAPLALVAVLIRMARAR